MCGKGIHMNIVSLIMNFLAPSLVGRIASAIGIEGGLAQKAIAAAIPSILSGIVGATSKPEGARSFADAIAKQDSGLLGNLGNMLTGQAQTNLVATGTSLLTGILGQSALGSLTGAVAKHAGIGDFAAKSLMGMLGPIVAGVIGKEQKAQGLDAMGLAKLLMGQKDNIAAAVPQGFAQLLGGTNLLDSVSGQLKTQIVDAQPTVKTTVVEPVQRTTATAAKTMSGTLPRVTDALPKFSWWPWLLAIAASSLLFYNTFVNVPPAPYVPPVVQPRAPATVPIRVGQTDVAAQMTSALDGLLRTVRSIRDEPTARQALPRLQETQREVDRLTELTRTGLQPDARRALAGLVNAQLPVLQSAAAGALATPQISGIVKTVLETLITRLSALGKV